MQNESQLVLEETNQGKWQENTEFTRRNTKKHEETKSKQKNHKSLIQNIHTLNNIKNYFYKFGFSLVFKYRNEEKYIACSKKQKNTHSLNLIFIKK